MPGELFDELLLFQDLSPTQRSIVEPLLFPCTHAAGDVIFEQGGPAEYLYIVVEGEVVVRYKPFDGPAITVARVRPNGVVGWSTALGSPTYTSSGVCSTACRMLRLSGEDLRFLCEKHPETGALVLERLAAVIAERLRNTHEHVISMLEQGLRISVKSS